MYRLAQVAASWKRSFVRSMIGPRVVACACLLGAGGAGCATTSEVPEAVAQMSAPEALHHAGVLELKARGHAIEVESAEQLFVSTRPERVDEDLRERFTVEVIRGPTGVMALKVTVRFERRYLGGEQPQWLAVDNASLRERARRAELELGRAIERRFEGWAQAGR